MVKPPTDATYPGASQQALESLAQANSAMICLFGLLEKRDDGSQTIWIDREFLFQRLAAHDVADEILAVTRDEYGMRPWFIGDPAGRNKESDQESWESNLRRAGLPMWIALTAGLCPKVLNPSISLAWSSLESGFFSQKKTWCTSG